MKKGIMLLLISASIAHAKCTIFVNDQHLEEQKIDPLFSLLSTVPLCPNSIQALHKIIKDKQLTQHVAMVANRGRNNPGQGSFSFFESISGHLTSKQEIEPGDFFLGYFTGLQDSHIILDQEPEDKKLLIEVISWDKQALLYNFYELRAINGGATRWYYRGNSQDAFKDNTWLYRQNPVDEDHFGKSMRCSACHNAGEPIMKEQTYPFNDWWSLKRPLILIPNQPDQEVQSLISELVEPELFAVEVKNGAGKLAKSAVMIHFQHHLSLQEQLRPLFCTTEINLQASAYHLDQDVLIPSDFWINPLLGTINMHISQSNYEQLLADFDMQFPETSLRDADHPWLTPVKGLADIHAIKTLIQHHIITKYFAQAVLLIDFKHPLYSSNRCELLQLVPHSPKQWMVEFINNLQQHPELTGALELANNLTKESLELDEKLYDYIQSLMHQFADLEGLKTSYRYLIAQRRAVFASEMSQNPLGQILEPGFRVIFPESRA